MIKQYLREAWEAILMAFGIDDSQDYECNQETLTDSIESACEKRDRTQGKD